MILKIGLLLIALKIKYKIKIIIDFLLDKFQTK